MATCRCLHDAPHVCHMDEHLVAVDRCLAARQLLVVGTMGSGTTATATGLAALGLEVKHESSDTLVNLARDGTVSWFHGVRLFADTPREATVRAPAAMFREAPFSRVPARRCPLAPSPPARVRCVSCA